MRILQIIQSAYRCNIEEQDDPVVWITHAMRNAGGEFNVLLRGNAVNYSVTGQDSGGVCIGGKCHAYPPDIAGEVDRLLANEVGVYVIREDAAERGICPDKILPGVREIDQRDLPSLLEQHEQVWHW